MDKAAAKALDPSVHGRPRCFDARFTAYAMLLKNIPRQQYMKQCQGAYLVSKLLAPSLVAVGVKPMSSREGFCELSCNGPSIGSEGEGGFVHVPLPWSHICQDELDTAAPLGGLPKVQLPVQPAVIM